MTETTFDNCGSRFLNAIAERHGLKGTLLLVTSPLALMTVAAATVARLAPHPSLVCPPDIATKGMLAGALAFLTMAGVGLVETAVSMRFARKAMMAMYDVAAEDRGLADIIRRCGLPESAQDSAVARILDQGKGIWLVRHAGHSKVEVMDSTDTPVLTISVGGANEPTAVIRTIRGKLSGDDPENGLASVVVLQANGTIQAEYHREGIDVTDLVTRKDQISDDGFDRSGRYDFGNG